MWRKLDFNGEVLPIELRGAVYGFMPPEVRQLDGSQRNPPDTYPPEQLIDGFVPSYAYDVICHACPNPGVIVGMYEASLDGCLQQAVDHLAEHRNNGIEPSIWVHSTRTDVIEDFSDILEEQGLLRVGIPVLMVFNAQTEEYILK